MECRSFFQIIQNRMQSNKRINEADLSRTISRLREKCQTQCSEVRKRYVNRRCMFELIELMVAKEPTENEKKGRSSGSLTWRTQRGEKEESHNVRRIIIR